MEELKDITNSMHKLIIWDWNGTLLNDVETCVNCMNIMLKKRNMQLLTTDHYKSIFTFPVQKYYESVGFNFKMESFDDLSVEYIDLYKKESLNSPLQKGAKDVLNYFKSENYTQIILSASEQKNLETQVEERNISEYFNTFLGLNNIHAKSKLNNALDYIKSSSFKPKNILLIGDTYHDYEVASSIGCQSLLVNIGHQDLKKFDFGNSNNMVVNNFSELLNKLDLN